MSFVCVSPNHFNQTTRKMIYFISQLWLPFDGTIDRQATTWKTKPRNLNKIRSLCVCLRSTQVINGPAFDWRKRRAIGTHAAPNDHLIINQINCSHDYEPTDLDFSDCHSYTSESEWKRIQLPDPTIQHPTAINMFGSQNFVRKINKWMINKRVEQLKSIRLRKFTF